MTKRIKCETKSTEHEVEFVRVRVIRAPLVDTRELRDVLFARARALVV